MRTALALFSFLAIALVCLAPSMALADCNCNPGAAACIGSDGKIQLTWNMSCLVGCSGDITSIERKCGNGPWVVVVANPSETGRYLDAPIALCVAGWTYRWNYTVTCGGLQSFCNTDIVPGPCE